MGQEVIFNYFNIKTYIISEINEYIMIIIDIKRFTAVSIKPMK